MGKGDTLDSPALLCFGNDGTYLFYCHLFIDIIFEIAHLLPSCIVTNNSLEDNDTTNAGMADRSHKSIAVEWLTSQLDHRLYRSSTSCGGNEHQFITLS